MVENQEREDKLKAEISDLKKELAKSGTKKKKKKKKKNEKEKESERNLTILQW